MNKIIYILILLFLLGVSALPVAAVTKQSGSIKLTLDEPLYASTTSWHPGLKVSQTITVQNTSGDNKELSFQAINTNQTGGMADMLFFNVQQGSSDLYGASGSKTLENFWNAGEVKMMDISGGTTKTLTINISMDETAGNEYQGKQAQFDLNIGFKGEKPVTVSSSNGTCGKSKPSAPGALTGAVGPEDGQITLSWDRPTSDYTYFLLAYSDDSDAPKWGNPDIGTDVVYTVSGLGKGTYYFWVRAGNGCMPGDFVGPTKVTISSGAPGSIVGQPASGFAPGVLGETTENEAQDLVVEETRNNKGEVRGLDVKNVFNDISEDSTSFNWSFPLTIGGLIFLGIILGYFYLRKD